MAENKKEIMLRQANPMTEGRYDFSKIEKNAYYCVVRQVRKDYIEDGKKEFANMVVDIPESCLDEITDNDHRTDAREALKNLHKKLIEFEAEDGSWFFCGFINWAKYDSKKRVYKLEVSSQLMPYLVELADRYTEYSLTVAISLKSKWSQRFYELCCQYKAKGSFFKTIDQLRYMFCLEKAYKQNQDFKRYVLDVAENELKQAYEDGQCDLWFETLKEGRGKTTRYTFKIHTRHENKKQEEDAKLLVQKTKLIYRIMLANFKNDPKFSKRVYDFATFHIEKVDELLSKLERIEKKYPKSDRAPIIRFMLEQDFELK